MAKKSYAVMNMAYRDETRTDDYLLERVQGKPSFNFPVNMGETQYMYTSELTEMICQNTLSEIENDQYTQQEINNKLQDLCLDIERHANDVFASSNVDLINNSDLPSNEERLTFDLLPIL